jgi:hypothetical protein
MQKKKKLAEAYVKIKRYLIAQDLKNLFSFDKSSIDYNHNEIF